MIDSVANKHSNCQLAVRWKLFRGKTFPTPGLYCSCHNTFLDWLPENLAYELIDVHHLPVEPYVEKKRKPKSAFGEKYMKNRQKKNKAKKGQNHPITAAIK